MLAVNTNSLCAKVLKARYSPTVTLQASLKSGASLKGLETSKLGYIWRIGTRENVSIWNNRWIPLSPDQRVIIIHGHTMVSSVNDLVNPMTGAWDDDLIKTIFNPVDARRILQISLNYGAFEDFIAWNPDHKGYFLVRSVYRVHWIRTF